MYDDILLPFDGSEGAKSALTHAGEIADWAEANIALLYVADTTQHSVTVVEGEVIDVLEREGEEIVAEGADLVDRLGVSYDTDVVQGNPAPTIVEYAERYGYDLVVMPTHGREGISRYLLGSVSEKVVRLSPTPVLTTRMQPDERHEFPYHDVLIPTDGSPGAERAGKHGLSLAESLEATVHVLSVIEDTGLGADVRSAISDRDPEGAAETAVEDLVMEAESRDITETRTHIDRGKPVERVLEYIDSHGIDAVVMGATGRRGTDRILLGSVAEKTVRSASVPVLTLGTTM